MADDAPTSKDLFILTEKMNSLTIPDKEEILSFMLQVIPISYFIQGTDGVRLDLDSLSSEYYSTIMTALSMLQQKVQQYQKPL